MTLSDWFELCVTFLVLLGILTTVLATRFVSKKMCGEYRDGCGNRWANIEKRLIFGNLILADLCEASSIPPNRIQNYARALNLDLKHFEEYRQCVPDTELSSIKGGKPWPIPKE